MVIVQLFWTDGTGMTKNRKSLSDTGWTKEQIKQYDALALEITPTWLHLKNEVDIRSPGRFP